jgi:hypothetical protein
MIHQRQGLAFGLEAGHDLPGVHAELEDLERGLAPDRLGLLGHPDRAERALADDLDQLVAADAPAGRLVIRRIRDVRSVCSRQL